MWNYAKFLPLLLAQERKVVVQQVAACMHTLHFFSLTDSHIRLCTVTARQSLGRRLLQQLSLDKQQYAAETQHTWVSLGRWGVPGRWRGRAGRRHLGDGAGAVL